jgi:(2Fe-2S) ferredoxin
LKLSRDEIIALVEQYEKETRAFKTECLQMCWHMRGGLTYEESIMLSQMEREIISAMVKEHMETTKKSGLPYF